MPIISPKIIEQIASLSRLKFTKQEISQAASKLAQILSHFTLIQKIETTNVPTSEDVTGLTNIWRTDIAQPQKLCSTDTLLQKSPATHQRHFKVKAVF